MLKLKDRLVIVLCNLKASKLRGILSEAMVLCATESNTTELLMPPTGACTGDRITVDGYCVDDEPVEINKKNKIFEKVMIDLRTDENAIATYKQKPLTILGKGFVHCKSLKNAGIK
jgi:aminoacyl tRNA synthase complex-interacting multifunctional protein 1